MRERDAELELAGGASTLDAQRAFERGGRERAELQRRLGRARARRERHAQDAAVRRDGEHEAGLPIDVPALRRHRELERALELAVVVADERGDPRARFVRAAARERRAQREQQRRVALLGVRGHRGLAQPEVGEQPICRLALPRQRAQRRVRGHERRDVLRVRATATQRVGEQLVRARRETRQPVQVAIRGVDGRGIGVARERSLVVARHVVQVHEARGRRERDDRGRRRDGPQAERRDALDPARAERLAQDAIPVAERAVRDRDDAGQEQHIARAAISRRRDLRAARDAAQDLQRAARGLVASREPLAHREERLLAERARREQLAVHDALHVLELAALVRDAARDFLGQVRVTTGPDIDAIHQRLRLRALAAEAKRERVALLGREVRRGDHDRARTPRIAGLEILARRNAREREREPRIVRLPRAPLVAPLDRAEQLAAERQRKRPLDVVEHDRDRRRRVREHDLPEEIDEAGLARERGSLAPPVRDVDAQVQLVDDPIRDRVRPTLDVRVLPARRELREVDLGDELGGLAQRAGGAPEQARFAGQTRVEHEDVVARAQRGLERAVRGAFDVAQPVRLHRAADHEKLRRLDDLRHSRRL